MLPVNIAIVLLSATIATGTPITCNPFLWTTVGNHDPPPCYKYDENQILHQLQQIKEYYLDMKREVHDAGIFQNPHLKELMKDVNGLLQTKLNENDRSSIICTGCKAVINMIRYYIDQGKADEELYGIVEDVCTTFNIQSPSVCKGVAHLFGPEILHIANVSTIEPIEICSFLLGSDCGDIETPQWEIELPPSKPTDLPEVPPDDAPKLKVLHISDTHYDRFYATGSKVFCNEPLCCRLENGLATGDEKGAGKYGDWRCDTPEITLNSMLEHAATTHPDIAYIIWTGDLPAHDVWNQSEHDNLEVLQISVSKVSQYFPNVPTFPAVGNHEAAPCNSYPPPNLDWSISWLYDQLDAEWSRWLPTSTSETIKKGAYYTALIRPGLRIVSLNTNYCYNSNWWLVLNSIDPAQQLEWLVDVLKTAEDNDEKVHILAHIPPGQNDCLDVWKDNYYRIITRFQSTVAAQFFGHTHKDEYELYYDVNDDTTAVGIGYIGPGVTTYTDLNPGYRIYYVDGDRDGTTRIVLDHETWVLDLEEANQNDNPNWFKSYTAKSEYNMTSLFPNEWQKLYEKFKTDDELFQRYYSHYYKESPQRGTCDESCKRGRLCAIRSCRKYGDPTL